MTLPRFSPYLLATLIAGASLILPSQAGALTVTVNSRGLIEIFAGSVLGERSDNLLAATAQNRAGARPETTTNVAPQAPIERINPGTTKRIEFSREGKDRKSVV